MAIARRVVVGRLTRGAMAVCFCCGTTHHYMGTHSVVALLVLVALSGCNTERPGARDSGLAATSPAPDGPRNASAISDQTLLVGLTLRPDGTALLVDLAAKPIPWTRPGVPFDPSRHRPTESVPQAALPLPGGALPTTTTSPTPGGTRPAILAPTAQTRGAPAVFEHWLLVEHGERSVPYVLLLELGAPGEGGGDVLDRWDGSTHVYRAPFFGDGTRLTLVRGESGAARSLAGLVVTP